MDSTEERRFNLKALVILALGHMVTDIYQGALPAVLPFLKVKLSLSYSMAGVIMLASNLASSVIQPLFGMISDREARPFLIPAGCLMAGIGFCLLPFPSGFGIILFLVILSGLGIASFHPEGFKTAYRFTGMRPAVGMSVFSVGGNLGFALGPIVALSIVTSIGFSYLPLMFGLVLVFLTALSLLWGGITVSRPVVPAAKKERGETDKGALVSVIILVGTVILRSWIHAGLTSYIPFYYIDYLKGDPVYAGKLVSTFLIGGVIGTVLGAPVADRWGHKRYLIFSMLGASLVFPLFFVVEGVVLFVVLGVFGMVLISTFTVTIVMAQRLLPHNLGVASGLMVGLAIGAGGIGVTILGFIADNFGVPFALKSITVLPLLGFLLTLFVRYPEQGR